MLHILTSTSTILKVEVRPQESRIGDSNIKGVLRLTLKKTLTDESFTEQQGYLQSSAIAAYISLNKLDQRGRFRASVNLVACDNSIFNFTQGSSSSGLGYALACFDAWWRISLQKNSSFVHPIFATGEVLTSGHIKPIGHIVEKIESTCKYVEQNQDSIASFYLCYPQGNDKDIPELLRKRLESLGGILIPSDRLQHSLGQLLGDAYNGDPLGRWQPFKGLKSFDYEDSVLFFGRDEYVSKVCDELKDHNNLLIVSGARGAGKTSLILAGVIPKLEKEFGALNWATCKPCNLRAPQSILNLILELLIEALALPRQSLSEAIEAFGFSTEEGISFLQALVPSEANKCLLYIDQFEEVFSQGEQNYNLVESDWSIIDSIAESLPSLKIILAIRNEYLGKLLNSEALHSPIILHLPSKLTHQEWQSIIVEQALFSGIIFEEIDNNRLDRLIIEDAIHMPFALPIVSFLLEQLYIKASENGHSPTEILFKYYKELRGLSGVITYMASEVIKGISPSEKVLAQFFNFFVGITPEGEPYRKKAFISEIIKIDSELYNLVNKFIDANLIVSDDSELDRVTLINDSLFNEWALLQTWFSENKSYLTWKNVINPKFVKWKSFKDINLDRNSPATSPVALIIEGIDDYKKDAKKKAFELTDLSLILEGDRYLFQGLIVDNDLKIYLARSLKEKLSFIFFIIFLIWVL